MLGRVGAGDDRVDVERARELVEDEGLLLGRERHGLEPLEDRSFSSASIWPSALAAAIMARTRVLPSSSSAIAPCGRDEGVARGRGWRLLLVALVVLPGVVGEAADRGDGAGLGEAAETAAAEEEARGKAAGAGHRRALRVGVGLQRLDDLVEIEHARPPGGRWAGRSGWRRRKAAVRKIGRGRRLRRLR